MNKIIFIVTLFSLIAFPFSTQAGVIPCGTSNTQMCTICDIIVGFHNIIDFGFRISMWVGLLFIAIGGVMYTISAGDKGMIDKAKSVIKSVIIGIILMFSAWLMITYTMQLLSAKPNLGVKQAESWYKYKCEVPR